jgi:hypothetical protein
VTTAAAGRPGLVRRTAAIAVLAVALLFTVGLPAASAQTTVPVPTTAGVDLDECINSNPPPGCGQKPESPGDPGGSEQLALFGVMIAGLVFIGIVVGRSVVRRERATRAMGPTGR